MRKFISYLLKIKKLKSRLKKIKKGEQGVDWQELTNLTRGQRLVVERVRLASGVAIEGVFEVPALAQLSAEDQVFVAAFVRCHGSIK